MNKDEMGYMSLRQEVFSFLDGLRESGATNMFGASKYLVAEFAFTKQEARVWLKQWMEEYDG